MTTEADEFDGLAPPPPCPACCGTGHAGEPVATAWGLMAPVCSACRGRPAAADVPAVVAAVAAVNRAGD